jgi:hypothetical protein
MVDTIRRVEYFKIQTPDKPGEAARVLGPLRDAGVNLLAFKGFPRGGRWQMDFIPEDPVAFRNAAKRAGLKLNPSKTGFLVQGEDRVGAIADLMARFGEAKINVTAIDALAAGEGRFGAIIWVKPENVAKASKVLGVS